MEVLVIGVGFGLLLPLIPFIMLGIGIMIFQYILFPLFGNKRDTELYYYTTSYLPGRDKILKDSPEGIAFRESFESTPWYQIPPSATRFAQLSPRSRNNVNDARREPSVAPEPEPEPEPVVDQEPSLPRDRVERILYGRSPIQIIEPQPKPMVNTPPNVLKISIKKSKCEYCGEGFTDDLVLCPECVTPHHADCWNVNGCTTYACKRRKR